MNKLSSNNIFNILSFLDPTNKNYIVNKQFDTINGQLLNIWTSKFLTFQTLIPIQTSAFGLTSLRKNIIEKTTWQIVYSIELSLVYIYWYYEYGNLYIIPMSGVPYFFRKIGLSKYAIWMLFIFIDKLQRENLDILTYLKIK